ncbi:hypothetical protein N800_01635 [Lysobacter daejeonensis GH1-9]|uniref:PLD phosphodiesterase domain-containing protein n=1 Tax=Lysobacter daejeonensis GH1-9 TaxID=1385517 RepID=A0A0A0F0Q5_9GAMM|nr:hypothetical protein N800_01635 [Lysobacter daejeonensis GH1-9]
MAKVRLLTQRDEVGRAVKKLVPTHIAVAYVGIDWADLIVGDKLKEIVLSPTVGSNPKAIEALGKRLGWGNVHFLDQLHAKIYVGRSGVIVGSANLSTNALSMGGADLFEAVMLSDQAGHRVDAMAAFSELRETAIKAYPTAKSKKDRLARLVIETRKARAAGLFKQAGKGATFDRYRIGDHRIFVEWWTAGGESGNEVEGDRDYMNLRLGRERAGVGDWVLSWRCNDDGYPTKNGAVKWIWINTVRRGRSGLEDYADQVAETTRPAPAALPFEIDGSFEAAFRQAISLEKFWRMRTDVKDRVMTTPSRAQVEEFLKHVRTLYK